MKLSQRFGISGGSITGFSHLIDEPSSLALGNQDAFRCGFDEDLNVAIGVVSDGCSSSCDSKTGARLIASWTVDAIKKALTKKDVTPDAIREAVEDSLRFKIRSYIKDTMPNGTDDKECAKVVYQTFLATLVFFVSTPSWTALYVAGDGIYSLNGVVKAMKPPRNNAPEYLAYSCVAEEFSKEYKNASISIVELVETDVLDSIAIGTDGMEDLIASQSLDAFERLWREESFVLEPQALNEYLFSQKVPLSTVWEEVRPGCLELQKRTLFADDATVVVFRRLTSVLEEKSGAFALPQQQASKPEPSKVPVTVQSNEAAPKTAKREGVLERIRNIRKMFRLPKLGRKKEVSNTRTYTASDRSRMNVNNQGDPRS